MNMIPLSIGDHVFPLGLKSLGYTYNPTKQPHSPSSSYHEVIVAGVVEEHDLQLRLLEVDLSDAIAEAIGILPLRERRAVELRYGFSEGCIRPLREVGEELGICTERVRQIIKLALHRVMSYGPVKERMYEFAYYE